MGYSPGFEQDLLSFKPFICLIKRHETLVVKSTSVVERWVWLKYVAAELGKALYICDRTSLSGNILHKNSWDA